MFVIIYSYIRTLSASTSYNEYHNYPMITKVPLNITSPDLGIYICNSGNISLLSELFPAQHCPAYRQSDCSQHGHKSIMTTISVTNAVDSGMFTIIFCDLHV